MKRATPKSTSNLASEVRPVKPIGMSPFVQPHLEGKRFRTNKKSSPKHNIGGTTPSSVRNLVRQRSRIDELHLKNKGQTPGGKLSSRTRH